jgi:hypothetical protein
MRRLFILFLILLLPLQVFAGVVEDRLALSRSAQQAEPAPTPSPQSMQSPDGDLQFDPQLDSQLTQFDNVLASDDQNDADNSDNQDSPGDEPAEDFASHATFGDDAVPASFMIFAVPSPDLISTLHNDAASIPPYLPPAGRPPKI